jgi:predicted AAA+ superfamily ATPase
LGSGKTLAKSGDIFTRKRETDALLKAGREAGCKVLTVLTWDFESEEKFGSQAVHYLPLWKWLGEER